MEEIKISQVIIYFLERVIGNFFAIGEESNKKNKNIYSLLITLL
jgi:hypothetical protein